MRARVYRNLNTGLWSIQQRIEGKWVVVGHASALTLFNVTVRQSEAARQKVIRDKCRSVHCWVEGDLVQVSPRSGYKGRHPVTTGLAWDMVPSMPGRGITYNPYLHKTLVYRSDESEYSGSDWAFFGVDQKMYVL